MITDRLLGAGAFGKVYMAINESQRRQLACKVVDLRKLRPQTRCRIGRKEQPAQAEDVDNRVQLRKLAALADERKKEHLLEDKLAQWYREADILASINHVSGTLPWSWRSIHSLPAAEHCRTREGVRDRQYIVSIPANSATSKAEKC